MASPVGAGARRDGMSVARAVTTFAVAGVLVLGLVGVGGVLVLRSVASREAHREAEKVAVVAGRIVQLRLTDGILSRSATSLVRLDELVISGVLTDPIERVDIRDPNGLILYDSDAPDLIGSTVPLDGDERSVLATERTVTREVDPSSSASELERGFGSLLQVSLAVSTPDGHPLLLQVSLRFDSVAASGRQLWTAFLPVLAVTLLALALLQIPLAYRLARRVRESQRDRERLLRRAIEASDLERRRIAGDLHDGLVQQLAGLSMSLSAEADALAPAQPAAAATLREGAAATRQGVRSLRSALMGIYPPSLQRAGLPAALSDLAAPLAVEGVATELDVPPDLSVPPAVESLLFRAAQEALRNVAAHARATSVRLRVSRADGRAVLEVEDDGVGFPTERASQARADGHLGLPLLDDLARDAGGTIDVSSTPGGGTRVRLEVPVA